MDEVAVVTASCGRIELRRAIESVRRQTYPCVHYVFFDGVEGDVVSDDVLRVCELPVRTGINGMYGGGVYAASAFLVTERMMCWLDDDNWFDDDHVERLVEAKGDREVACSLRKLVLPGGEFFGLDNCESIGTYGELIDTNCYLMDRELAVRIAPLWYKTATHERVGNIHVGDRYIHFFLKSTKVEIGESGKYTVNYRLGSNKDVSRDLRRFFIEGNARMHLQYGGVFPWVKP